MTIKMVMVIQFIIYDVLYLKINIYFLADEVNLTWMRNADKGRRGLGGDRVFCRDQMYL